MNLLSMISPTSIMAAIIIALSISNALFYNLYSGAKDDLVAVQTTLSMERDQAKFDADQARDKADRVTADVSKSWAAALDHLRKHPVIRVLPAANGCVQNGNANAPAGLNVRPTLNPVDPTSITAAECEALINDGVMDSAQLSWLQHWIRSQQ